MLNEVEPRLRKALPPGHSAFGALAAERSLNAQQVGNTALALTLANQAIEIVERAAQQHGEGAQFLPTLLMYRASIEIDAGLSAEQKPSEAHREAQRAAQQLEKAVGADHPDTHAAEALSGMPTAPSP